MEDIKARKRSFNFTFNEKAVLIELVGKHKEIIECKRSDCLTLADKANSWRILTEEFNALSTHCFRSVESLKTCWDNIKRQRKKDTAYRKKEFFKTGGGKPPTPPPHDGSESIIDDILGPALTGIINKYDSDAVESTTKEPTAAQQKNDDVIDELTYVDSVDSIVTFEFEDDNKENDYSSTNSFPEEAGRCKQSKTPKPVLSRVNTTVVSEKKDQNNPLSWQTWTPSNLKRPISDELLQKSPKKNWVKRRRPEGNLNPSDQLIQEKIDLIKTIKKNAETEAQLKLENLKKEQAFFEEESKLKLNILREQLIQEKLKTQSIKKQDQDN